MLKMLTALLLALVTAIGLTGCSGSNSDPTSTHTLGKDAVIIDVRTPAEFAEGHLEGAVNIDVTAPGFTEAIGALPTDGEYLLYCRSGNRSAQAAATMRDQGFDQVTDAGSLEGASSSTGVDIVTE